VTWSLFIRGVALTKVHLDIVVAGFFTLFGLWVTVEAFRYGLTSNIGPGSGLFPFIAGSLMTFLSVANLVRALNGSEALKDYVAMQEIVPILAISGLGLFYLWLSRFLGVFLPLPFFLVSVSLCVEWRPEARWIMSILAAAVAFSALCYLVFVRALNVPIPRGPFGF